MPTTLDEAIKEAYTLCPAGEIDLDTLEISHPNLTAPIYLVKDRVPHNLTLENGQTKLFEAAGFRMTKPEKSEEGVQEITLVIDNVDLRVTDFINKVKTSNTPCTVIYRPYLASDPTKPQQNPPLELSLSDVQVGEVEVSGRVSFMDVINRKFPTQIYTRARFPGLAN